MVVAALWMDGKIILCKRNFLVFDASIWSLEQAGRGLEWQRGPEALWSYGQAGHGPWMPQLSVPSILNVLDSFICSHIKQTFIKSHQWPGSRLKLGLWSGNRGIWPPGRCDRGSQRGKLKNWKDSVSQKRQEVLGVGGDGSKQRGAGARYLPPNLAQASSGTLQWDRRQIRMWKPRLTLLVLEGEKKLSWRLWEGNGFAIPENQQGSQLGEHFPRKELLGTGCMPSERTSGGGLLPRPMSPAAFTCHNPGQALGAPLWDPGCHPSHATPQPLHG